MHAQRFSVLSDAVKSLFDMCVWILYQKWVAFDHAFGGYHFVSGLFKSFFQLGIQLFLPGKTVAVDPKLTVFDQTRASITLKHSRLLSFGPLNAVLSC